MLIAYFLLPGPTPDAGLTPVNVNFVYGPSEKVAQRWMPAWAWLACMMTGLPLLMFAPVHVAMARWRSVERSSTPPLIWPRL
jgi:hypothetical protein